MLAYFDCFSGISGDMTLGALVDLGVPVEWLKNQLRRLPLDNFDITVSSVHRNGIHAKLVDVAAGDETHSKNFLQIRNLIEYSPLTETVKSTSLQIFQKLAEAEADIHSCSIKEVHFHEVGGIDSIVDIVGTALGLEYLAVKKIAASAIPLGRGFVDCSHGKLPVPAPATLGVLHEVPVYGTTVSHELVTPTGAAIISAQTREFGAMPQMVIKKIGYGAGQRELDDRPNLLRIVLGNDSRAANESPENLQEDRIEVIETSIDDMNPELFGYLMDRLFEDGALDVCWIPVYMKKNRPATMLQVICNVGSRDRLIRRILSETTTLGVRFYQSRRRKLWRDQLDIETSYGKIAVKRVKDPQGNIRVIPEFEVCRKIALENELPLRIVYDTVTREAANWNET